ncbi:MAG TPA: hypothetical protein VM123_09015 [archaeon]|nr:hypothetical protein [archaeon]
MDQAKAEQAVNELQYITRVVNSGEVGDFKPSATLLERKIKPSDRPFIKKDASGHALYFIVEGRVGVDIGQLDRIIVPAKKTVGEMSMISTVLNTFDDLGNVESRTADVYAEEDLRLIVFNYSLLIEIIRDKTPELRKFHQPILINLNRILFRKLIGVNNNYVSVLTSYGLVQEAEVTKYPVQLQEGLTRFLKNIRTFPNISVSPHDMRGILIRENEPNSAILFLEKGVIKISMVVKNEETSEEEWIELDRMEAPMMLGESSILNIGSISSAQVEALDKVVGYRIEVQKLLHHLKHYPGMFETFFKLLLELNYFRTTKIMQKTANL